METVILFSPVRQDFDTLKLTLASHVGLKGVSQRWYYDDNDDPRSSGLLDGNRLALAVQHHDRGEYSVSGETHVWTNPLLSRIAAIRNAAVEEFLHSDADALFMVDSDLILHPGLIEHLIGLNLDIVAEVFWTKWTPPSPWMPNVWDGHPYSFRMPETITRFRDPGVEHSDGVVVCGSTSRVAGLGACTLIRREVFERGVSYSPVKGLGTTIWGEDRWFSIRADANGFQLHADTAFPPFHVYRREQLDEAKYWFEMGCPESHFRDTLLTPEWADSIEKAMAPPKKESIVCILPGETFSQAWVGAWTEILHNLVGHYAVSPMFGHSSVVYFTRQLMFDQLKTIEPRPDYVVWIDDDQILTVEGLRTLLRDLEDHPELDGVVGWAWCQQNAYGNLPMLSCGIFNREGKSERLKYEDMQAMADDLIPISYSGFPAVVMRGSVVDRVGERAFMPVMDDELFPPYGMSGEDVAFFIHAREKGLKFAVDRRVKVPHLKLRCAEPVTTSSLEAIELKEN